MQELYYDITSSYFKGHRCIIAEYGYSRDHRKDREQIVIGLVTTPDGFPIKCDIYPGNTTDKTTIAGEVEQLLQRYPIKEFVFVGDRGVLTGPNLEAIRGLEQQCVMVLISSRPTIHLDSGTSSAPNLQRWIWRKPG